LVAPKGTVNSLAYTFWWIYPTATALGGVLAGSFLYLNKSSQMAIKKVSDE
tara:strand:- start:98 stop:250 length:153 start_codon:yes stop_codon:yes gene_type:complete